MHFWRPIHWERLAMKPIKFSRKMLKFCCQSGFRPGPNWGAHKAPHTILYYYIIPLVASWGAAPDPAFPHTSFLPLTLNHCHSPQSLEV